LREVACALFASNKRPRCKHKETCHVICRFLASIRPGSTACCSTAVAGSPDPASPAASAEPVTNAAEPPPSVQPPAVYDRLDGIHAAIDMLRNELRAGLATADRSREIIVRLETENRALKTRESERRQEPLIKGLISLFDDLRAVNRAHAEPAISRAEESPLLNSLQVFERQALELLRRSDVEPFEPRPAERFDASRQEAWEAITTDSPDRDMHVAEVIRLGFEFGGRIIRPAAVKVYRHAAMSRGVSV
jgi:molecular chaperone GrpE (heat shock protein)